MGTIGNFLHFANPKNYSFHGNYVPKYGAYNLVSLFLASFATRMATQIILQMKECYQFSCHLFVTQNSTAKNATFLK